MMSFRFFDQLHVNVVTCLHEHVSPLSIRTSPPPSLPHLADASRIFEVESSLLRKVSGHRSIITAPTIQILNFANEFLQLFFSHLPEHKQPPLTELFFSGTCSEAYIYPLYGVTMATKIKV